MISEGLKFENISWGSYPQTPLGNWCATPHTLYISVRSDGQVYWIKRYVSETASIPLPQITWGSYPQTPLGNWCATPHTLYISVRSDGQVYWIKRYVSETASIPLPQITWECITTKWEAPCEQRIL